MRQHKILLKKNKDLGRIFKYSIIAIILVLIPCVIFTYRLQFNPPGFFIDESIYGYEAYTILKSAGFSSSGEFLPRLFDPGHHGLFTYQVLPFIGLFGVNEVSVRLASVFSSILLLITLYFFLRHRCSELSILLAALWWPLTSWVFLCSRIGMEFITYALISTLAMWVLVVINDSQVIKHLHLVWFDILMVILFFIFSAGKILALGYVGLALVILVRKRASYQYILLLFISGAIILALSLPYIIDRTIFYRYNELSAKCTTGILNCFARNIASHFSLKSYFANTYIPADFDVLTHSITGTSLIPRPLSVFILIGLLVWAYKIYKRDSFSILLGAFVCLGILPASLAIRGFDSYRSISLLPILFVFIILGLELCIKVVRQLPSQWRVVSLVLFLTATALWGCREVKYLFGYEYPVQAAVHWGYGYRPIYNYFLEHYDQYDEFIVTDTITYLPDLYIRFFDPDNIYTKINVGTISGYNGKNKALLAARRWEVDLSQFKVDQIIYYPNGNLAAFYIGELIPTEDEK